MMIVRALSVSGTLTGLGLLIAIALVPLAGMPADNVIRTHQDIYPPDNETTGLNHDTIQLSRAPKQDVTSSFIADGTWQIECVDCPKNFRWMTDRSLQLDAQGHPHLAYGGDHLYYAYHDGSQWHLEIADDAPGVGRHASLALDPNGQPHVSYYDADKGALKYAHHDGIAWQVETVDDAEDTGLHTSLALDSAGHPHVSYYSGAPDYALKYTWHDGADWHVETVDSSADAGLSATSLTLNDADQPRIGYVSIFQAEDSQLKIASLTSAPTTAERATSTWDIEIVEQGDYLYVADSLALVLDTTGRPHIGYSRYNYLGGELRYGRRMETGWEIETIPRGINDDWIYESDSALALDIHAGQPHLGYLIRLNDGSQRVQYLWRMGETWHAEVVDDGPYKENSHISLVLDPDTEQPHLSYATGWENYDLKYARRDGVTWQVETVDDGREIVGRGTWLALDLSDRPHISYGGPLGYAWQDESGWHLEALPLGGWDAALALDGSDQPHLSYVSDYSIYYARREGEHWNKEQIEDCGPLSMHFCAAPHLALAPHTDQPYISYWAFHKVSGPFVQYAWHDGSTWHPGTVEAGVSPSLAVDEAGRPHVSYSSGGLKYAWRDETGWQIETVPVGDAGNGNPSLALDSQGYPHIGYAYGVSHTLHYARYDGTTWLTETICTASEHVRHISLVLDKQDRPHISYYDGEHGDLRYAWHDSTGWKTQILDSEGDVGHNNSLALSQNDAGWPQISYYDASNDDLKYARLLPPPLGLNKRAAPDQGLQNNATLTYTLTLSGPDLAVRLRDPLPAQVRYISGTLTGTLVPAAVYSPNVRAIVWQGTLPTDSVPTVRFQVARGITGTGSLDLAPAIINTAWLTDIENTRAVSATVIVNARHVYLPLIKCEW